MGRDRLRMLDIYRDNYILYRFLNQNKIPQNRGILLSFLESLFYNSLLIYLG